MGLKTVSNFKMESVYDAQNWHGSWQAHIQIRITKVGLLTSINANYLLSNPIWELDQVHWAHHSARLPH